MKCNKCGYEPNKFDIIYKKIDNGVFKKVCPKCNKPLEKE